MPYKIKIISREMWHKINIYGNKLVCNIVTTITFFQNSFLFAYLSMIILVKNSWCILSNNLSTLPRSWNMFATLIRCCVSLYLYNFLKIITPGVQRPLCFSEYEIVTKYTLIYWDREDHCVDYISKWPWLSRWSLVIVFL